MNSNLVGNPSIEEWADWIVSRYNFCERNAGESLREIALVALRNAAESRYRIMSDGDHDYFIPIDQAGVFNEWLELVDTAGLDDDVEIDYDKYTANRIDGRFTFTNPRCE